MVTTKHVNFNGFDRKFRVLFDSRHLVDDLVDPELFIGFEAGRRRIEIVPVEEIALLELHLFWILNSKESNFEKLMSFRKIDEM